MIDLVTLLFFYLFLTFSIIGYGKLVFIFSKENFDVGFEGLTGILILIIVEYKIAPKALLNFVFPNDFARR